MMGSLADACERRSSPPVRRRPLVMCAAADPDDSRFPTPSCCWRCRQRDAVIPCNLRAGVPATRLGPRIGPSIGVVVERVLAQNAGLGSGGPRGPRAGTGDFSRSASRRPLVSRGDGRGHPCDGDGNHARQSAARRPGRRAPRATARRCFMGHPARRSPVSASTGKCSVRRAPHPMALSEAPAGTHGLILASAMDRLWPGGAFGRAPRTHGLATRHDAATLAG